jgi:hypothetical protein
VVFARRFDFDGPALAAAIPATFARQGTPLPGDLPVGLTDAFAADETKARRRRAFVVSQALSLDPVALSAVATEVRGVVTLAALAEGSFDRTWSPGAPWRSGRGARAPSYATPSSTADDGADPGASPARSASR